MGKLVDTIDNEIESLKTIEDKKLFLNTLHHASEQIEIDQDSIDRTFLKHRKNLIKQKEKLDSLRLINLYKAEKYLKEHSYPKDTLVYTKEEVYAPFVCLLNSNNLKEQLKYIPTFETLHNNNILPSNYFLNYLTKIYYLDKGLFYPLDKTLSTKEMISDLLPVIKSLE